MPNRTKPLPELSADHVARFHASYEKDASGCWPWSSRVQSGGYGAMYVRRSIFRAHRLSFAIHTGRDPGDLLVCHRCDNPRCVNPDHLWLGTDQDNANDREAKGRGTHPGTPAQCIKCGHDRDDDYVERRPGGREVRRCRNCVKLRDAGANPPA